MSATPSAAGRAMPPQEPGWRELWLKEDWWAVWLGLGLVVIAFALFARGSSIAWIAVAPAKWSTFPELGTQLAANVPRYVAQFGLFLVIFYDRDLGNGTPGKKLYPLFFASLSAFAGCLRRRRLGPSPALQPRAAARGTAAGATHRQRHPSAA